ncbi:hypothetical protein [Dermatobacter hominis]|uniref:hypothetical protein n=1 Tax=Dermatobacter hominis TaxID=2884263 RepID=UPI001D12E62B|nr:hypothetical protein [Dermatobacter hominis]UDY37911.1 hypothetical protein LH044_10285 [Dermatobacter hominis]
MTDTTPSSRRLRPRRRAAAGLVALLGVVPLAAACSDDGTTVEADSPASSTTTTAADPNASTTIPDMGSVAGPVGSCLTAAAKFTNLVQGVLEGSEGAKRSQEAAEQLKAELPADLQDDADVVAKKFGDIAARGGTLTDADVNDPAYSAATAAISGYFVKDCK